MDDALLVLLLTAAACAPLGVFLILRRLSMMADAISHTVLLGIVLAFFVTHDLGSPWLLFGAALMGVVTVSLVELLGKTHLVKYDDAIGVIFPLLFALAVILISKYAGNAHLDTDMVLMGEVIYAGLNTVGIGGVEIPAAALKMGGLALLIAVFITVFYKELKVSAFDGEYARLIGVPTGILFYAFMSLTSLTTVAAFDAVGATYIRRKRSMQQMQRDLFLLHIGRHTAERVESAENHANEIGDHLKWSASKVRRVSRELIDQHLLHRAGSYYLLTDTGAAAYKALCERYFI